MSRNLLSIKRKKKLSDMCQKFLPKYQKIHFDRGTSGRMICMFLKTNDSDIIDNCNKYVHWMELCMDILLNKVAIHVSKGNPYLINENDLIEEFKYDFFKSCFIGKDHPIDVLHKYSNE